MSRVLVLVSGDRIGDALLKWPVIAGLKRSIPTLGITWATSRRPSVFNGPLRDLVAGTIDNTLEQIGVGRSWLELIRPPPPYETEILISTEPKLRHAILDRRIAHQRFISPAARFICSDLKPPANRVVQTSVQGRLQELFELAVGRPLEALHKVPLSNALRTQAAQILPSGSDYIGLSPGAGGERKRWPLQRFIETAQAQHALGRIPAFFLGPEEEPLLGEIKTALPNAIFPEYDDAGVRRGGVMLSIALANRLRCAVANDSGGGHILAAGGKPLVSLYGHTSAEKFRPRYGPHIAISAKTFGATTMEAISIETVIDTIEQLLSQ